MGERRIAAGGNSEKRPWGLLRRGSPWHPQLRLHLGTATSGLFQSLSEDIERAKRDVSDLNLPVPNAMPMPLDPPDFLALCATHAFRCSGNILDRSETLSNLESLFKRELTAS